MPSFFACKKVYFLAGQEKYITVPTVVAIRYTVWFSGIFPERYMRKKKRYCFVLFTNSLYISLQLCYNTLNWFYIAIS